MQLIVPDTPRADLLRRFFALLFFECFRLISCSPCSGHSVMFPISSAASPSISLSPLCFIFLYVARFSFVFIICHFTRRYALVSVFYFDKKRSFLDYPSNFKNSDMFNPHNNGHDAPLLTNTDRFRELDGELSPVQYIAQ